MAILDLQPDTWHRALGLPKGMEPVALILEGTWWRDRATRNRLARLADVQETQFPDIFTGKWNGLSVAYCCAYGAARAVEPAHVFAQMGTPLLIQIGTCGAIDSGLETGTVMVPDAAAGRDGVSQHYCSAATIDLDLGYATRARTLLAKRGIVVDRGAHLTWPSLFAQTDANCTAWAAEGLRTVDMETAAVAAVAQHFGARAVALLTVWDTLSSGKTFLDPLTTAKTKALTKADAEIFEVALDLAEEVGLSRAA